MDYLIQEMYSKLQPQKRPAPPAGNAATIPGGSSATPAASLPAASS